jgi:hypothetical protein
MVIGTTCPRYAEYAALFAHSADLQKALDAYYATMVRFCSKAITVMERSRKCSTRCEVEACQLLTLRYLASALVQFTNALFKPFENGIRPLPRGS